MSEIVRFNITDDTVGESQQSQSSTLSTNHQTYAARSLTQDKYANKHDISALRIHMQHHIPSGLSQACHSFKRGEVGLFMTAARLRMTIIAIICA
jgi:hypothetical protein